MTVSVPFIPAAAWPGSVHMNGNFPAFLKVTLSVAVLPALIDAVFLPAILKSWLIVPLFVTLNVVTPFTIVFFERMKWNSVGLPAVTLTVVAVAASEPPKADTAATSETAAARIAITDPF